MNVNDAQEAASLLGQARLSNSGVSLPENLIPANEDDSYAVQSLVYKWLESQGQGRFRGYKIGCTAAKMQEMLGVPHPAFGCVLENNTFYDEATFRVKDYQRVGVECEIAVEMASDLPASQAPYDYFSVEAAIGPCRAAIEIVDNRYGDFLSTPAVVMMADDFFHSACVLGPEVRGWRDLDLAQVEGRTFIDGRLADCGPGSQVLGHPLETVVWLANRLATLGRELKAGEFILTGTLAGVQWIDSAPADTVISIDGLGDVKAAFL